MRALLISDKDRTQPLARDLQEWLEALLGSKGFHVESHELGAEDVVPCTGCLVCHIKATGFGLAQFPPTAERVAWFTTPPSASKLCDLVEVRMGFEPTYDGFANHCLAAWLPHRDVSETLAQRARRSCHDALVRSTPRGGADRPA